MQACAAGYALTYATIVSQLNGRRADSRQVQVSYTSYSWLLLAPYHVHLDLQGLGLLLPVS
jgi:hypothetical protein